MSRAEGTWGEAQVANFLRRRGYQLLAHSYHCRFGEVDLIARQGSMLCFVEVKTRTSDAYGRPSEAVVSAKQRRYRRIAQFYWLETGKETNARFDVVEVWADGKVEHYKYAF